MDSLTRLELGLHLTSSDGIVASIKLVLLAIDVLTHSDCLKRTRSGVIAGSINFRQVNGVSVLHLMEVVIVLNADVGAEIAAHRLLSDVIVPF